jgi:hypothetical protein
MQFLQTEISAALTFARIAHDAASTEKRRRNRQSAQEAYDTVVKFAPRVGLSSDESRDLKAGLEELRRAIDAIPEA